MTVCELLDLLSRGIEDGTLRVDGEISVLNIVTHEPERMEFVAAGADYKGNLMISAA